MEGVRLKIYSKVCDGWKRGKWNDKPKAKRDGEWCSTDDGAGLKNESHESGMNAPSDPTLHCKTRKWFKILLQKKWSFNLILGSLCKIEKACL